MHYMVPRFTCHPIIRLMAASHYFVVAQAHVTILTFALQTISPGNCLDIV